MEEAQLFRLDVLNKLFWSMISQQFTNARQGYV